MAGKVSYNTEKAREYLESNPGITAQALATKFKISISTVTNKGWWKNRNKEGAKVD